MLKGEKIKSNFFKQEVFVNRLFGKIVDKKLSCKFKLAGSNQCKGTILTHRKFVDIQ